MILGVSASWRFFSFLSSVVLALALACAAGLLPIRIERRIDPSALEPAGGFDFVWRADWGASDAFGPGSTLCVLEDGKPLGPAHAPHDDVAKLGRGRFSHWARAVHLSSSDGTDPRTNARAYAVRDDFHPGDLALAFLIIIWALANRKNIGALVARIEAAPPERVAIALAAIALVLRAIVIAREGGSSFGGHLVSGLPFSDARSWDAMAADFATGERGASWSAWSARRPLPWIFLGAIYAWTGPSLAIARAANALLGAIATVAVWDGVRRLARPRVALLAAITQALLIDEARTSLAPLSEPLGNALGALALWSFAVAMHRETRARAPIAASGALLALANLARPLTLACAVAMPAALVWISKKKKTSAILGAIFIGATLATLAPWLARQKIVHGISSISDNASEALYAATSEKDLTWNGEIAALASGTVAERVRFYNDGVRENLRDHAPLYVKRSIQRTIAQAAATHAPRWLVPFACLIALASTAAASVARARIALAIAVVLSLAVMTPIAPLAAFWIAGAVIAIATRSPIAIVAASQIATWLTLGFTNWGGTDRRVTHGLDAAAAALAAFAIDEAIAFLRTGALDRAPIVLAPVAAWAKKTALALAAGALLFLAIGVTRASVATAPARASSSEDATREVIKQALEREGAAYLPIADRLQVRRARVRPGYLTRFEANERIDHWSPLFASRPYGFFVFETCPEIPEIHAVFPQREARPHEIARIFDDELVLVGVPIAREQDGSSFEVIAIKFVGTIGGTWSPDAKTAVAHAAFLRAALGR